MIVDLYQQHDTTMIKVSILIASKQFDSAKALVLKAATIYDNQNLKDYSCICNCYLKVLYIFVVINQWKIV